MGNRRPIIAMTGLPGYVINTPGPIGLPDRRSLVAPIIPPVTPVEMSNHGRCLALHLSGFAGFFNYSKQKLILWYVPPSGGW
ncbi:MAG: hypothetical protein WCI51_03715 [Lentisphaerota bacterium]